MSKFVAKFRKENDYEYNDDFGFKPNRYDQKKRFKSKEFQKRNKEYDPYDDGYYEDQWNSKSKKYRR